MYTIQTTLNGQLMLSMLAEDIVLGIDDITVLQVNTDGLTVRMLRTDVARLHIICDEWEKTTNLTLEYMQYSKMMVRDVNNYSAITTDGKAKYKGAFEIEKDYHKDSSFKIIPIALSKYFFEGIPLEETIKNHTNIYDFCGRQKFVGKDRGEIHRVGDQEIIVETQQKNTRYYISQSGESFMKHYGKGSYEKIHKGYQVVIFNKYVEKSIKEYDIDYRFYITECKKEIDQIENKQLRLEI